MESQKEDRIENPWCLYGAYPADLIGFIISERRTIVGIRVNERNSLDSTEYWKIKAVKERFATLEQAVEYLKAHKPEYDIRDHPLTDEQIENMARNRFPSQYGN